jgi:membrane-anchored protein YejM (alkaline phosphatase superfamily)
VRTTADRSRWLLAYALLSFPLVLLNVALLARQLPETGLVPDLFFLAALLDSSLLYLLIFLVPVGLAHAGVAWLERRRGPQRAASALVLALAVLLVAVLQIALFADRRIYEIYGFHVNGFVVNLLVTPGGIASMGGDDESIAIFAGIALAFTALQALLLALARRLATRHAARFVWPRRRALLASAAAFGALVLGERLGYGVSNLFSYGPVLDAAAVLPWYEQVSIRHIANRFGIKGNETHAPRFRAVSDRLHYPLRPIERGAHPVRNIVWLVSESLRADMLDAEIMPSTWAFAQRALWFRNHYSGGNGTRMGMFTMFYGLHGSYWFPFLHAHREPLLVELLRQDGYQLGLFTSANFRYPEFDRTIWANVPAAQLHSYEKGPSWQRDRHNIDLLLSFIDQRDPARPFLAFQFFESPHARYQFPPEAVIRRPYLERLRYATMDLERDMGLIFARYVNACHHLDTQIARVLEHLEKNGLLDSTLVVVTGDHGEEFLEKGRWGHGSAFSEEQTRVPLVMWIPGEAHREVTRMTSHVDIPATLLPRLGVQNPPEDYSFGFDLLGEGERTNAVLADWNNLALVDAEAKLIFPVQAAGFLQRRHATTAADAPLSADDTRAVLEQKRELLIDVVHDLARFSGRG